MIRHAAPRYRLLLALLLPGLCCGRSSEAPSPAAREAANAPGPSPRAPEVDSALPAQRPERLEIEVRRRTADGDDMVLKLTPAGARYGVSRGKARVALSYRLDPGALDEVYATLREQGVDRITTEPRDEALLEGTSLRVLAGPGRYSASAMGRQAPSSEHAEAYAACIEAVEALLPRGRNDTSGTSDGVVELRWDPSVGDRAAALDLDVGEDLLGLHRVSEPDAPPRWALHLRRPRPLQVQLRTGAPPKATTATVPPGGAVRVTLDSDQAAVVLETAPPRAPAP